MTVVSRDGTRIFQWSKNIVAFPLNASDSGNQESDTEEVSGKDMKEIYEPAGELEIEEDLKSDDEAELSLLTHIKRRRQELPKWKSLWF